MLNVFIVDDEYYFREALKIRIDWQEMGLELCGEARNGQEALESIEKLLPDIALVDINMPIMDGLEFVENVRERKYDIKIIILTGYNEFSYAKQAISMGVENYLLKPLNTNELKNELNKVIKIIDAETNKRLELDKLKKQIKENYPVLKEKLLNDLIEGGVSYDENFLRRMEYLNMCFIKSCCYTAVVLIEIDNLKDSKYSEQDKDIWCFAIKNIAAEIFSLDFEPEICFDRERRVCILLGSSRRDIAELNVKTIEASERIRKLIRKYLEFTSSIGIGNFYKELNEIEISYKEAVLALKNKITLGTDIVIDYNSISEYSLNLSIYPVGQRSRLLMCMRVANFEEVNSHICRIFDIFKSRNIRHELIISTCIELISTCFEYAAEIGIDFGDISGGISNAFYEIQSRSTIDGLKDFITNAFSTAISLNSKGKSRKNTGKVVDIKKCIEDNYSDMELNAESLSKRMHMNYCYICTIFKKETGFTINEYLTEIRMKKAKELMDSGTFIVNEIAEKVGYEDSNYFSRCFKKAFNVTPSKYLNRSGK